MMSFSEVWNELGRLEELIRLALNKSGSIPESVAGTGFWRSLAGVLQPTASEGLQGQIAGMNAGGTDIKWQATWDTWVPVSGVFTPAANQIALLVDTTGPQTTITTPANPYDGQMLIVYDYEGGAATNPIILTANTGTTIDDPSFPGAVPGAGGHIAQQGMTAIWKFFGGASQWQLIAVTTPYVQTPNSWAASAWFIDQSNKSGVASDTNSGTSRAKPLLTGKELVRRWNGTVSPTLTAASCLITLMSGSPNDSDPLVFSPDCVECAFQVTADTPTATATGVLAGVVANSITTNQALNATLPAGTVAGSLIVNTSRVNSFARAFKSLGGNNWQISQPINPLAVPTTGNPVQNNAWANGDAVNIFPPATNAVGSTTVFNCNITRFTPRVVGVNAAFNNVPLLSNVNCGDTDVNGFGFDPIILAMGCQYYNCSFSRIFNLIGQPSFPFGTNFIGCDFGDAGIGGFLFQRTSFFAGSWRTNTANWPVGAFLDCGVMFFGTLQPSDDISVIGVGTAYVDGGALRSAGSSGLLFMVTSYNGNQPALYGTGGADSRAAWTYTTSAVLSFPCAGGLKIFGLSTAYSYATSAGTTTIHQVALTPANLDAAAGAAGFGGYAVWPNVGCFTNGGGAQP
jgi:hypothetical protein